LFSLSFLSFLKSTLNMSYFYLLFTSLKVQLYDVSIVSELNMNKNVYCS
jgi:hypothetical protein